MNVLVLYFVLLKATVTAFAGLASLAVVRDELVVKRAVLTDAQLNEAVVITHASPGPAGLYVVSVGYFVRGIPGAIAGWLAMVTGAADRFSGSVRRTKGGTRESACRFGGGRAGECGAGDGCCDSPCQSRRCAHCDPAYCCDKCRSAAEN